MTHPDEIPSLVFADEQGNIRDFPELSMAGMAGGRFLEPRPDDLICLPEGSELFTLPDRLPVGISRVDHQPLLLEDDPFRPGRNIQAVAAFMAPAHTSIYSSAYQSHKGSVVLPLFAYAAVGWYKGRFWTAGFRCDRDQRQDFKHFNQTQIDRRTRKKLKKHRNNRLIQHLGKCCLTYQCPAARNYFLGRWEAPLPTSPVCNARCLGCISLQPSECCPSTQDRITFVPSVQEITEIAVPHLNQAARPIVSFGQGCEGEPLLQADLLESAVSAIRSHTGNGTINMNSNASLPDRVERLAAAGLDSIRVSLNSARETCYHNYYRPHGYTFSAVRDSITVMKRAGRFVSLNYFILPGFTDSYDETEAFFQLIEKTRPDFIQLRNLNMDPEWYLRAMNLSPEQPAYGIRSWLAMVKKEFPFLKFGYFNPCLND